MNQRIIYLKYEGGAAARAAIRAKYTDMRNQIEAAATPDEIKVALGA
jgi:hypothetical protein